MGKTTLLIFFKDPASLGRSASCNVSPWPGYALLSCPIRGLEDGVISRGEVRAGGVGGVVINNPVAGTSDLPAGSATSRPTRRQSTGAHGGQHHRAGVDVAGAIRQAVGGCLVLLVIPARNG